MQKGNIFQIEGTWFPAGRRTRVMLGENGAINGEYFCQGFVVIEPGGAIPAHAHPTVESYTILRGQGEMTVEGERQVLHAGDFVYMAGGEQHGLRNTGSEELHMMFVYAPKMVADHWAQELDGTLS